MQGFGNKRVSRIQNPLRIDTLFLFLALSFCFASADNFKGKCPKEAGDSFESVKEYAHRAEKSGNLKRAHACHLLAADIEPERPEPWYYIGEILRRAGNNAEAVVAYKRAISLGPTWHVAHFNLANALKDLANAEEAVSEYKTALNLGAPFQAAIYNNLALAYGQLNKNDLVLENYRYLSKLKLPCDSKLIC